MAKKRVHLQDRRLDVHAWISMTSTHVAVRHLEVFYVGQKVTTIDDVICAAHFRGELEESWWRVCRCEKTGANGLYTEEAALQARAQRNFASVVI